MAFTGTAAKIFVRPSGLYGSGDVDTNEYPPVLMGDPRMGVSYEAVAVDENDDMIFQPYDDVAGVGFEFQVNGNVLIGSDATPRSVQDAITADVRQRYGAADAVVVYITDNKGWI